VGFWRGFAVTLRPYLFFVSGTAGLLGLAAAPPLPLPASALALGAFFVSYGLGQALTDVFQTDTDSISSPYRPLVRGEISRGAVLLVSLSGLLLCGLTLALFNPWNLALAAAAVAGLAAYTPLKRRWWGGPPCNAAVMALLPAMGFLCAEPSPARAATSPILLLATGSVFASYAVFVLLGYLKDVEADRATGYETLAVRFGRRAAVLASGAFGAAGLGASILLLGRVPRGAASLRPGVALWLAGAILLVAAHWKALSVRRDAEAFPAVVLSVRAFLALHLGEASALRPSLVPLAVGLLLFFEATLARRPCREQV
jgi:4-hydroxybenzoate polyprenyltransferase